MKMEYKSDICCIFNYFSFYRKAIYELMDKELKCDFYIGENYNAPLKKADGNVLNGFKGYLTSTFGIFYRLKGAHKAVLNPQYKKYIALGDSYCLSIWWLLIWSKIRGKKTVLWGHGWYRDGNIVQNIMYHIFWRLPSHVMTYNNYSRNHMIEKGISPQKITPIYNSLDYDEQILVRKDLHKTDVYKSHFENENPVLLYIGRLQKRKKIEQVIEAMSVLKEEGVDTNFVIIGDAAEETGIERIINEYGLNDHVWIYGPCYDEKTKGELMYNADLCVSPGNVGLTAMDSLMFGLPVATNSDFSTQMPEFESIEEGMTGTFFKKDDIKDIADKISKWFEKHKNASRDEIAQDCYKVIDDKWNPHYQIKVIKNIIKNL